MKRSEKLLQKILWGSWHYFWK